MSLVCDLCSAYASLRCSARLSRTCSALISKVMTRVIGHRLNINYWFSRLRLGRRTVSRVFVLARLLTHGSRLRYSVIIMLPSAADCSALSTAVVALGGATSFGRRRALSGLVYGVCVDSGLVWPLGAACLVAVTSRHGLSPPAPHVSEPCVSVTTLRAASLSAVSTAVDLLKSMPSSDGRRCGPSVLSIGLSVSFKSTPPLGCCSRISRFISLGVKLTSPAAS